jgi:hypothetical protein
MVGQRTPLDVPELWTAGRPGPLDVPIGALLAPFAIPRQAIRLWGDALLDPLGGALAAVGIAVAARRVARDGEARLRLLALAAALGPAFLSSYDRPSLMRLLGAPVVLALFAASGFEALRRLLGARRPALAAACATGAIALGGTLVFDVVNPRILRSSWLAIALESLEARHASRPRAAMLTYGGELDLSWLHVDVIAAQVPREPVATLRFESEDGLARAERAGVGLLFWSPALERDQGVRAVVCARWPGARIYTISDRARLSTALAARLGDTDWEPAVAAARWVSRGCGGE